MSYYIRERIEGSTWDFIGLTSGGAMSMNGEPFNTKSDAMAAWAELSDQLKAKHSRAYLIGPYGGFYSPINGARLRKDPES